MIVKKFGRSISLKSLNYIVRNLNNKLLIYFYFNFSTYDNINFMLFMLFVHVFNIFMYERSMLLNNNNNV